MYAVKNILDGMMRSKLNFYLLIAVLVIIFFEPSITRRVPYLVDYNALSVISCFILISRGLIIGGLVDNLASRLAVRAGSPVGPVFSTVIASYLLSVIVSNDGAVLIMVPMAVSVSRIAGINPITLVIPVILAANTGSMLTAFGSPQNIVVWQHYRLSALTISSTLAPLSLAGLLALFMYVVTLKRPDRIPSRPEYPRIRVDRKISTASLALLAMDVILGDLHLGLYAFMLTVAVFTVLDYRMLKSVDWSLIISFLLVFIMFGSLTEIVSSLNVKLDDEASIYYSAVFLSQLISNVPATIALTGLVSSWKPLLIGVNVGGYITPIGSIANILGLRLSAIKWSEYLRETVLFSMFMIIVGLVLSLYPL